MTGADLPWEDAEEFIRIHDADGDGVISFEEFCAIVRGQVA